MAVAKHLDASFDIFKSKLTAHTTYPEAIRFAKPVVMAIRIGDRKLLSIAQQFPPAATDLKAEVRLNKALAGYLQTFSSITPSEIEANGQKRVVVIANLRSDLGLSQLSG